MLLPLLIPLLIRDFFFFFLLGECYIVCRQRGQPHSAGPTEIQITSARRGHSGCSQHGWTVQVEDWRAGV